ncbi:hypothetical protein ES332_D04G175700v1 [Gossypium tomentosum]|uniref:Uncharacterized protein n=1 Tax=Gossypium tomentosum TaxID=34277 RepID=A0A5D2LEC9_GOSTO|nr:hypothetical protein ES332_D04G175700v1 [Gossypium tomentosum]
MVLHNVTAAVDKKCHGEEADLATDGVVRRSIPSAAGQAISSFLGMIDACFSYFRHQNNASILREKVTVKLYSDFPSFSIGSWTVPLEN